MDKSDLKIPKEVQGAEFNEPSLLSTNESKKFQSGEDLEAAANHAQHGRREDIRDHLAYWLKHLLRALALIAIVFVVIWAWHLLGPPNYRWLRPDEIETIKSVFSTATIGAVIGFLIKSKYL